MKNYSKIKVEKNIPIPPRGPRGCYKYPFDAMDVGDSFFVKGGVYKTLSASVRSAAHRMGRKFTCRVYDDGIRVWRIL
jgi:hypothetical protein